MITAGTSSMTNQDTSLIFKALHFAAKKHRDQRRKDPHKTPYINHPIAVADLLLNTGKIGDSIVLAAALLHDTIEDTDTTAEEITIEFGELVCGVVEEVTDDKSLPKATRKQLQIEHAPHLSSRAKLVKLADKICNLNDLLISSPADWSLERQQQYFDWAYQVFQGLKGINNDLEILFTSIYAQKP